MRSIKAMAPLALLGAVILLSGCKAKPPAHTKAAAGAGSPVVGHLSATAERGRTLAATCLACHNAELNPPLGPPLFGISKRYKQRTADKAAFVTAISSFAAKPTEDAALFTEAIKKMGLMKPMALPPKQLEAIATYIYEETFPPPCSHWRHAIAAAKKAGETDHVRKDQRMYNKLCK